MAERLVTLPAKQVALAFFLISVCRPDNDVGLYQKKVVKMRRCLHTLWLSQKKYTATI
jgi:hypothetical protein